MILFCWLEKNVVSISEILNIKMRSELFVIFYFDIFINGVQQEVTYS